MDAEEAIQLLLEHDTNTIEMIHKQGEKGEPAAIRRQARSAKKVLTAMMGREPTEEELHRATSW